MFQKLAIKNFQSHKDTHIDLVNGVNVLVGSSDQGKSAILRAILWAVNNRPLGIDDIVSYWARDKKGKIEDELVVQIWTENGTVIRRRVESVNQYVIHRIGEKDIFFNVINKDVPEDIQKFFRLSDVNIQQQHDAPFLLSASASDVAKYFNKIVRLDVIDTVLGNAESARRDTNKKIKETDEEKKNLEKQLEDFNWIDTAQELSEKLSKVNERKKIYEDDWNLLGGEIENHKTIKEELQDTPDIKKANSLIEKIEGIKIDYDGLDELEKDIEKYKEVNRDRKIFDMIKVGKDWLEGIDEVAIGITEHKNKMADLQKEINGYTENKKLSDMGFDKKCALELIKEIEAIRPEYNTFRVLGDQLGEYNRAYAEMEQANKQIANYKMDLPEVCPTCGAPMGECRE